MTVVKGTAGGWVRPNRRRARRQSHDYAAAVLSWRSRNSLLSICSEGSVLSIGSVGNRSALSSRAGGGRR